MPLRNTITGGRLWRQPGRSIVKLEAGAVAGYGEGGPIEPAAFDEALAVVKGREATSFEIIRTLLPAGSSVEAAFNCALLDITGKLAKAPIHHLLGGPTRNKARALGLLQGATDADLIASMTALRAAGYRAFRFPAADTAPATVKRFEALRKAGGDAVDFVVDVAGAYPPARAATLAASLERMHPLWIDEPCSLTNLKAVAKISEESVAPLGFGRHAGKPAEFQELLREQVIDVLRPSTARMSISSMRRAAAIAETYYVAVAPHHTGGAIGAAAALHLAASIPNFVLLDVPLGAATVKDGFAELPTGPGLGITINEGAF